MYAVSNDSSSTKYDNEVNNTLCFGRVNDKTANNRLKRD